MAESDPIRVFLRDGEWIVDYGSYASGYHPTRHAAIGMASAAARFEHRELLIDAEAVNASHQV